ncbi:MAG TPA: biotin--[acetyl-CoA-carboxylase] ligase [Candidatus Wunengus sp. YC64]|uniref:biotin--[acetyl-CoA-carboxylase] ligase n=1 Tax=Candidatus Wunengus sp. YC64 TaxID=3367700 RepID=UPI004029B973
MSQKSAKAHEIFHPPLIPPIPSTSLRTGEEGKAPPPPVGEGLGEGCFRINTLGGWCVHRYDRVGSTNDIARSLPPWHAVRADSQTSGRGRQGRLWISDYGGLWLSMVVPVEGARHRWKALPLAAGWAILDVIKGLGVQEARLRWPNDIMVNDRKLAGILVEQFHDNLAVVGVGINVFNRPDLINRDLAQKITRLSDHINPAPSLDELTGMILKNLENIHRQMKTDGFSALLNIINTSWSTPRRVALEFDRETQEGLFLGVDDQGDLLIENDSGYKYTYSPHRVKLFREVYTQEFQIITSSSSPCPPH